MHSPGCNSRDWASALEHLYKDFNKNLTRKNYPLRWLLGFLSLQLSVPDKINGFQNK